MKALRLILLAFCISFVITGVSFSGDVVNMVQNSSFEDGTTGWQLLITAPAGAKWEVEKDGVVGKCVHVTITAVSGTSWHVEIHQPNMVLKAGQEYTYNFWYKSGVGEVRVIQPGVEGLGASDWWQDINIKDKWEEFTKTWIQSLAGSATLHFAVAQTKGEVYLDQVRLYEGKY
ncbi:MAG: CBM-cenC protein, partial [Candidatus Poribacteria bacterium]|nr:CBM-cenC protein [Candidatus Poribacteria bacterium]